MKRCENKRCTNASLLWKPVQCCVACASQTRFVLQISWRNVTTKETPYWGACWRYAWSHPCLTSTCSHVTPSKLRDWLFLSRSANELSTMILYITTGFSRCDKFAIISTRPAFISHVKKAFNGTGKFQGLRQVTFTTQSQWDSWKSNSPPPSARLRTPRNLAKQLVAVRVFLEKLRVFLWNITDLNTFRKQ